MAPASQGLAGRRPLHRAAWVALWVNLALAAGKGVAGLVFASHALVADALHSLGDAAGSFAVVFGVRVAELPPDRQHRYGHAKAESLAGLAVAALLILAGLAIGGEALVALFSRSRAEPDWAAAYAAAGALVVKEGLYQWNVRLGRRLRSPALLANAADHRSDEWTSAAAVLGVLGARLGLPLADPLAALVVAALVLVYAVRLAGDHVDELLDREADSPTRALVRETALSVHGVREVQRLRTRRSGPFVHVDLEIGVDGHLSLVEADRLAHDVIDAVERLDVVQDVVVHVNPIEAPGRDSSRA
ncbi:MAG: cation transporter [Firmicutes bacterium]|nr:cation transporter [Bacillota bacterium]